MTPAEMLAEAGARRVTRSELGSRRRRSSASPSRSGTVAGYAVGLGPTREEAQKEATKFFHRDINRGKPDRIYVERFEEGRYVEVECLEATGGGYVSRP